jgi:vacuolar-type H+-ATPase subunit I/STV1
MKNMGDSEWTKNASMKELFLVFGFVQLVARPSIAEDVNTYLSSSVEKKKTDSICETDIWFILEILAGLIIDEVSYISHGNVCKYLKKKKTECKNYQNWLNELLIKLDHLEEREIECEIKKNKLVKEKNEERKQKEKEMKEKKEKEEAEKEMKRKELEECIENLKRVKAERYKKLSTTPYFIAIMEYTKQAEQAILDKIKKDREEKDNEVLNNIKYFDSNDWKEIKENLLLDENEGEIICFSVFPIL